MAARPPPASKAGGAKAPIPPNQTLYVTNLPSAKIQKADLKTALYMLFSTYGPVLDVVALKTTKMRGQAHIVFRDMQAATQAMRTLEGFTFLGRELRISYAKSKSDTVAKLDGTYKMPGSAAANVEMSEVQQSIFNAPTPGSAAATAPAPRGLPSKPPTSEPSNETSGADARGQKRTRDEEEEDDSDSDVAMEEESDDE
ncbi:U2 small nuclear ribonucleoprotein B'' [Apiospora aurea]|uniref:U2 small nuclear ribonucleoprotein B n=1 Tax=Apiospora aurea TaxID=335848 RepID=A0ABR1QD15_9PEZI